MATDYQPLFPYMEFARTEAFRSPLSLTQSGMPAADPALFGSTLPIDFAWAGKDALPEVEEKLPQSGTMASFSEASSLIRSHKPSGARSFFFRNHNGRFPHEGAYSLEPFDPPDAPPGTYQLYFCNEANGGIQLPSLLPGQPPPTITWEGAPMAKRGAAEAGSDRASQPKEVSSHDPIANHPQHIANRLEFEAIRMADAALNSKQLIDKNMGVQQEVAQAYLLNSYARQEVQRSYELVGQQTAHLVNLSRAYAADLIENGKQRAAAAQPQHPPDSTAPVITAIKDLAVVLTGSLLPLLAGKTQLGKRDPIMDAVIEDEDPEIAKTRKDIAEARRENDALRAAGKAEGTKSNGPATETKGPTQADIAKELEEIRAIKAALAAELEQLRKRGTTTTEPLPADVPQKTEDAAPARPGKPLESKPREKPQRKSAPKALPPKRSAK